MAAFFLRVRSLDAGASVIFFLPERCPSGNKTYQPIIPIRIQVKGAPILGLGASSAEKTLALTYGCRTTEFQAATLFFLTPINYLMTSHTSVATVFSKLQGI